MNEPMNISLADQVQTYQQPTPLTRSRELKTQDMKPILIILIAFGAMTFIVNSMLKVDAKVTFLKAELAKEKALKESYIMELGFVDSLFRDCAEANKDLSGQNEKLWNYLNIKIDNEFKKRRDER